MVKNLHFHFKGHRFHSWLRNCDPTCPVAWAKKKKKRKVTHSNFWVQLYKPP